MKLHQSLAIGAIVTTTSAFVSTFNDIVFNPPEILRKHQHVTFDGRLRNSND